MLEDIKSPQPKPSPKISPSPSPSVKEPTIVKPLAQPSETGQTPNSSADIELDLGKLDSNGLPMKAADEKVKKPRKWFKLNKRLTKKQTIIAAIVCLLLIGGGLFYFLVIHKGPQPAPTTSTQPPAPTTEASKLTGLQVNPALNKLPVTGVMIENSIFARPQSGLKEAGIVFEAIAEGGITRFLALYQSNKPDSIGPIRSARPYYLQWLLPFQGAIAHVGGSPDALNQIKSLGVRDLDQFANGGSYSRVTSREAPHNVYTSMKRLLALQKSKGFKSSSYTSFGRKEDQPATTLTAKSINFGISGPDYNVHYDYNKASNNYKRSVGGAAHRDDKSKKQLTPKVVIALVMPYSLASDQHHSVYNTIGSGVMYVFQDGIVTKGTWKKTNSYSQFKFVDSGDKPIALNAGQTWITVVGTRSDVTYK